MNGLKSAPARAGYRDAKSFCRAIGMDYPTYSKAANGHVNLNVPDFNKVRLAAKMAPQEVATADEVDYGIIPHTPPRGPQKPEKRKKTGSLRFRYLPKRRKQIDKDLKTLGYATVQSWGDRCIEQLHEEAEQKRRERRK